MSKLQYKQLLYPPKIILAWGEAIGGNAKIRDWLGKNGYPELYTFVFALNLKEDAREWLRKNGFPHLLAMIEGVEGSKSARNWLKLNSFTILFHMALAADGDQYSQHWLLKNAKDFAHIARKIEVVKDIIQMDHDDPHRISGE